MDAVNSCFRLNAAGRRRRSSLNCQNQRQSLLSPLPQVVYSHHSRHTRRMRLLDHVARDGLGYPRHADALAAVGQFICGGETGQSWFRTVWRRTCRVGTLIVPAEPKRITASRAAATRALLIRVPLETILEDLEVEFAGVG